MLSRDAILRHIPHQGASCLLDKATSWDENQLVAESHCHNDPANPYRMAGQLPPVTGVEMAMQAAALHGALTDSEARQGWLASMRDVHIHCTRLDNPGWPYITIIVKQVHQASNGMIYHFTIQSPDATSLLGGTGTVMLP